MAGELAAAVCEVVKAVGYIRTDGTVQAGRAGRYRYLSDEALLEHVRGHMAANGLALIPTGVKVEERFNTASGKQYVICSVHTFLLMHSSGETQQVQVGSMGADNGDKAFFKSNTGALKYALRQVFLIPTGDDPDRTPSGDPPQQRGRRPQRQQRRNDEPKRENRAEMVGIIEKAWAANNLPKTVHDYLADKGAPKLEALPMERMQKLLALIHAGEIK